MGAFMSSAEVNRVLKRATFQGIGIMHSSSLPLIADFEGRPVLASFTYLTSPEDAESEETERPSLWAVADLLSGEVLGVLHCRERDFSNESFANRYSLGGDSDEPMAASRFTQAFEILDEVRRRYEMSGQLDAALYARYFDMVVEAAPPALRVFYEELGSPGRLAGV